MMLPRPSILFQKYLVPVFIDLFSFIKTSKKGIAIYSPLFLKGPSRNLETISLANLLLIKILAAKCLNPWASGIPSVPIFFKWSLRVWGETYGWMTLNGLKKTYFNFHWSHSNYSTELLTVEYSEWHEHLFYLQKFFCIKLDLEELSSN